MTVWEVLLRRHTDRDTFATAVLIFDFQSLHLFRIILAATFGYPGNILTPTSVPIARSLAPVSIASTSIRLTLAITSYIKSSSQRRTLRDNGHANVLLIQAHHHSLHPHWSCMHWVMHFATAVVQGF
jgi:hypothetical protein